MHGLCINLLPNSAHSLNYNSDRLEPANLFLERSNIMMRIDSLEATIELDHYGLWEHVGTVPSLL